MGVFIDNFSVEIGSAMEYYSIMKKKCRIHYVTLAGLMISTSTVTADEYRLEENSIQDAVAMVCDTTIPAYAESFQNDRGKVIWADLQRSEAFRALDPFQQSAFARLLGQTTELTPEQASKKCHQLLAGFDPRDSTLALQHCKSWALSVHSIAMLQEQGALTDTVRLSMAGGNAELSEVIKSVAAQADNLAKGATADTLAQAHYYTCFKNSLNEKSSNDE